MTLAPLMNEIYHFVNQNFHFNPLPLFVGLLNSSLFSSILELIKL